MLYIRVRSSNWPFAGSARPERSVLLTPLGLQRTFYLFLFPIIGFAAAPSCLLITHVRMIVEGLANLADQLVLVVVLI